MASSIATKPKKATTQKPAGRKRTYAGKGPGRMCAICNHPKRAEIEEFIISGASYRIVVERYSASDGYFTKPSVMRHFKGHMMPDQLALRKEQAIAKLWDAKGTARETLSKAIGDLEKFREGGANGLIPGMYGQVRNLIETLARLDNQLSMARNVRNTVNIVGVFPPAVMAEFRDVYPEAFSWLLDRLRGTAENMRDVTVSSDG